MCVPEREHDDFLHEVIEMKTTIGNWIPQEEIPVSAGLKVIRINAPDYGLTDDEIQDRNEFIRCYLLKEFELQMMIPAPDTEDDFFIGDYKVDDEGYSAFHTMDYQRTRRPFDNFEYAMKHIMDRVNDLAILHSCCSCDEDRNEVYQRYESYIDSKLREVLGALVKKYPFANESTRWTIKKKIGELNRRILEGRKI